MGGAEEWGTDTALSGRGRRCAVSDPQVFSVADLQAQYAGCWVAVLGDDVVDARPTPYELVLSLRDRRIEGTTILRVPAEDDLETVGIG